MTARRLTLRTRLERLEARKGRPVTYVLKWSNQSEEEALAHWRVKNPNADEPSQVYFLVWGSPQ